MNMKKLLILAALSFFVNAVSVLNAVFSFWTLILIIALFFVKNLRTSKRSFRDKKIISFVQTYMIGALLLLSTGTGFIGVINLRYGILIYLPNIEILFLILAIIGGFIYYYFAISLFREALKNFKQKEVTT